MQGIVHRITDKILHHWSADEWEPNLMQNSYEL